MHSNLPKGDLPSHDLPTKNVSPTICQMKFANLANRTKKSRFANFFYLFINYLSKPNLTHFGAPLPYPNPEGPFKPVFQPSPNPAGLFGKSSFGKLAFNIFNLTAYNIKMSKTTFFWQICIRQIVSDKFRPFGIFFARHVFGKLHGSILGN